MQIRVTMPIYLFTVSEQYKYKHYWYINILHKYHVELLHANDLFTAQVRVQVIRIHNVFTPCKNIND